MVVFTTAETQPARGWLGRLLLGGFLGAVVGVRFVFFIQFGIIGTAITICIAETVAVLGIWVYLMRVHFRPGTPAEAIAKVKLALSAMTLR